MNKFFKKYIYNQHFDYEKIFKSFHLFICTSEPAYGPLTDIPKPSFNFHVVKVFIH